MNTDILLTAVLVSGMVVAVGVILLCVHHILKEYRIGRFMNFVKTDLNLDVKCLAQELLNYGMDILPDKLVAAKKTLEKDRYAYHK